MNGLKGAIQCRERAGCSVSTIGKPHEYLDPTSKGNGAIVAGAQVAIDNETKRFKITAYQATPTKLVNVYTK